MEDPSTPRMKYKVIRPGKPNRVNKAHGKVGLKKGRRSPRKVNGPRMPKREMGHKSPQTV